MWETIRGRPDLLFSPGSLYLLISLGFSIICGVLRIFHLGYAYLFTLTVYLTWMLMKELGFGLIPALLGMVVIQFAHLLCYLQGDHHEICGPGRDYPDGTPADFHHRGTGNHLPLSHPGRGVHSNHPHRRELRDRIGGHLQSAVSGGGDRHPPDGSVHPFLP